MSFSPQQLQYVMLCPCSPYLCCDYRCLSSKTIKTMHLHSSELSWYWMMFGLWSATSSQPICVIQKAQLSCRGGKKPSLCWVFRYSSKNISYWNLMIRCYRYTSEWAFSLPSAVLSHCGSMKNGQVFLIYEVLIFYSEGISRSVFKCERLQNEESYCLNCSLQGTMSLLISVHSYSMTAIRMAFLLITIMWSKQKLLNFFNCLWFLFILPEYSGMRGFLLPFFTHFLLSHLH